MTLADIFLTGFFILGACLGSFANVIIYRLPRGESVVAPRSHCYKCKKPVAFYDNIPILSWFILRGKCRQCKTPFSIRYAIVELVMASLFAALYMHHGISWTLFEHSIFAFGVVTASVIDLDHMILPDTFTLSGIVLGLLGATLSPERDFMPAFWGVLLGGGSLYLVAIIYATLRKQEGMGGGDIKLLAWIGALLGWTSVPFVIFCSSLIGSIVGIGIILKTKGEKNIAIPFGPYLAAAAFLYIFYGQELTQMYIDFFIPALSQQN